MAGKHLMAGREKPAQKLRRLLFQEDGAISVDWVILTASVAVLAVIAVTGLGSALTETSGRIGEDLTAAVATAGNN